MHGCWKRSRRDSKQAEGLGLRGVRALSYLAQVSEALSGSPIAWGAQNVSEHDSGAYTGEVSDRCSGSLAAASR